MKAFAGVLFIMILSLHSSAQDIRDSSDLLEPVIVKAYDNYRNLVETPVAVSVINKSDISRFNNTSLVNAMNINPGVRMEERSPGSYRLNIRGSSLRSPFGVRNVKVYYNDIPYTDPGGNSFFNQLGLANLGRIEVIKGPGGSMYGAGTGGVILITNDNDYTHRGGTVDYSGGSFGSNNFHANLRGGKTDQLYNNFHLQYQNSNGYRDQTKMEKRVISWDGVAKVGEKGILRANFMQGNLFYETPGGLTAAEYANDPKAARPGAEVAHASIEQKLFFAGFNYFLKWNDHWESSASLYGSFAQLNNPTIRNYERRTEPHFGTRNTIRFRDTLGNTQLTLYGGIEAQQGFGTSKVYANVNGLPGAPQTDDQISNGQTSVYFQGTVELNKGWFFTGGASFNLLKVDIEEFTNPYTNQERKYNNEVAPRLAVLKKITPLISVYGSVAKGFSPPTTAEILPSTGIINTSLEAEHGINTELGIKGNTFSNKLFFDVNVFNFMLENTIAQRRDSTGADYFVNSGSTKQRGVETFISYQLAGKSSVLFDNVKVWASHTWNNFRYNNFQKVADDTTDYSGNKIPGIPKNYLAAGFDALFKKGFYINLTYYYSDPMPLNDANTDHASSYNLLDARIGYKRGLFENAWMEIFAAVDNAFDVKYSLGNDINAFGGRYYNAAPGINYFAGISLRYNW